MLLTCCDVSYDAVTVVDYQKLYPVTLLMKQDQENVGLKSDDTSQQVRQLRDKFEYDRERRMRDKGMPIYFDASFVYELIISFTCFQTQNGTRNQLLRCYDLYVV